MSTINKEKSVPKRKKNVLPLKVKVEMLDRLRLGESLASIARSFDVNESTVRSIKKFEDKIRNSSASPSISAKIVRDPAIEKMESALLLWIEDRSQKRMPLSGPLVREKARRLYAHFKEPGGQIEFRASEGWFNKFKQRQSLHSINIGSEAAASDTEAAARYVEEFSRLTADGGYTPKQVFNAVETTLFWKRMPNKTFISETENSTLGFNAVKDKVNLLLCSNAMGDCFIKPLMLYKSLNPCALNNKKKDNLPVFWCSNKFACITSVIFCDWFQNCFVPQVKTYLTEENLDFKAVLVLDNALGHLGEVETMHTNIKVIFLPPKTTALLQPMDQGIIKAFKLLYIRQVFKNVMDTMESDSEMGVMECWKKIDIARCVVNIKESLDELVQYKLQSFWKKLWPDLSDCGNEGFEQIEILTDSVVQVANEIGQGGFEQVDASDIQDLLQSHNEDLSEIELEEMLLSHRIKDSHSHSSKNCKMALTINNLNKGLRMASQLCDHFVKIDPSFERSLVFKRKIYDASTEYQAELKSLLKAAKQKRNNNHLKRSNHIK